MKKKRPFKLKPIPSGLTLKQEYKWLVERARGYLQNTDYPDFKTLVQIGVILHRMDGTFEISKLGKEAMDY